MMNMGKMMHQAKKMQEKMQQMQEEMAKAEVSAEAGNGMVRITATGDKRIRRIEIAPALWQEQDKALIEDMVAAAVNAAMQQIEDTLAARQKEMFSGMPLPPGFSL
jgi:DNA-binding YbaB/EbfC family protein